MLSAQEKAAVVIQKNMRMFLAKGQLRELRKLLRGGGGAKGGSTRQ